MGTNFAEVHADSSLSGIRALAPGESIDQEFVHTVPGPGWSVAAWHESGDGVILTADTADGLRTMLGNLDGVLVQAAKQDLGKSGPIYYRAAAAEVRVFDAEPDSDDASDMYVMEVFGVSLMIRRRKRDDGTVDTYVHVDNEGLDRGEELHVEVLNGGENEYKITD